MPKLSGSSDRLPLSTDGMVEATLTDGEPFGPERLREFFAGQGEAEPGGGCGCFDEYGIGARAGDDLTVVVAEAV